MRKKASWTVAVGWMLSSLLFQGCATKHIPLKTKDLTSLAPLRVSHYIEYKIRAHHSKGQTIASTIGGATTAIFLAAWESSVTKEINSAGMPNINEMIAQKFVKRASEEIPNCPPMVVEEQPIQNWRRYVKDFSKNETGSLIMFFGFPKFFTGHGLWSYFRCIIWNAEGEIIWQKDYEYSSKALGRQRSLEEYRADNFELLKEEIKFAAETTVSYFIATILKETGTPTKELREGNLGKTE